MAPFILSTSPGTACQPPSELKQIVRGSRSKLEGISSLRNMNESYLRFTLRLSLLFSYFGNRWESWEKLVQAFRQVRKSMSSRNSHRKNIHFERCFFFSYSRFCSAEIQSSLKQCGLLHAFFSPFPVLINHLHLTIYDDLMTPSTLLPEFHAHLVHLPVCSWIHRLAVKTIYC